MRWVPVRFCTATSDVLGKKGGTPMVCRLPHCNAASGRPAFFAYSCFFIGQLGVEYGKQRGKGEQGKPKPSQPVPEHEAARGFSGELRAASGARFVVDDNGGG